MQCCRHLDCTWHVQSKSNFDYLNYLVPGKNVWKIESLDIVIVYIMYGAKLKCSNNRGTCFDIIKVWLVASSMIGLQVKYL